MEVVVLDSARKHGIADDDSAHALNHAVAFHDVNDDVVMAIGPDRAGNLLEVGFLEADDDMVVIVHAMPARPKFLPR